MEFADLRRYLARNKTPHIRPLRQAYAYRGTSLIRNSAPLGTYSWAVPRAIWRCYGEVSYLMSEAPLYGRPMPGPYGGPRGVAFLMSDVPLQRYPFYKKTPPPKILPYM